ncbi:sulfotransferase 6B1-like [Pangshura tecta]
MSERVSQGWIRAERQQAQYLDKALADSEKAAPENLLFSYKGILYPVAFCSLETFHVLDSFEARSDDVILAGYAKNGDYYLTVKKGAVSNQNGRLLGKRHPPSWKIKWRGFCHSFQFSLKRMKELTFRRIIVTHHSPQVLPKSIFKIKAKILLLVRNPKDTAVSYFHFHNNMPALPSFSSWDEYFAAFMHEKSTLCFFRIILIFWVFFSSMPGSYFDYLVEWNKHVDDENVMVITYDELKENQTLGLKKIADFFGFSLSEEEIQIVAEKNSFKAMKEKSFETHGTFGKIFFRKGIIGDWKDHFSEAQSKEMDRKFEECLAGTKLGEKMKYGVCCKA